MFASIDRKHSHIILDNDENVTQSCAIYFTHEYVK